MVVAPPSHDSRASPSAHPVGVEDDHEIRAPYPDDPARAARSRRLRGLLRRARVHGLGRDRRGQRAPDRRIEPRGRHARARSSAQSSKVKSKVASSGIATWFGPGFYGQKTACGQTLTPAVVGVANRTLPCGTLVKVDYHGQTLVVPVLDRGPYADNGASWDLTAGAASALDITGTVRIGTHVVGSVRNTPTLGSPRVTPAQTASGGVEAG